MIISKSNEPFERLYEIILAEQWDVLVPAVLDAMALPQIARHTSAQPPNEEHQNIVLQDLQALMAANLPILRDLKISGEAIHVGPLLRTSTVRGILDYVVGDTIVELKTSSRPVPSWIRQVALYVRFARKYGIRTMQGAVENEDFHPALHVARYGAIVYVAMPNFDDEVLQRLKFSDGRVSSIANHEDVCDQIDVLKILVALDLALAKSPVQAPSIAPKEYSAFIGTCFDRCVKIVLGSKPRGLMDTMWRLVR